jgi:hypothetical protein
MWEMLLKKKKKLHNEELNDLYSSPNIVRLIKLRRMRRAGLVAQYLNQLRHQQRAPANEIIWA